MHFLGELHVESVPELRRRSRNDLSDLLRDKLGKIMEALRVGVGV